MDSTLPLERLSPDQRHALDQLVSEIGTKGVLVGAFPVQSGSELRPLVMMDAQLFIVRRLRPALQQASSFQPLQRVCVFQQSNKFSVQVGGSPESLWIVRPFFKTTLVDALNPFSLTIQKINSQQIASLITEVLTLHRSGFVHGHIKATNVGVDTATLKLLDHGVHRYESDSRAESELVDVDCVDLARLVQTIMGPDLTAEQRRLLGAMLDPFILERPTLDQLARAFSQEDLPPVQSIQQGVPQTPLPSGKILSTDTVKVVAAPEQSHAGKGSVQPLTSENSAQAQLKKLIIYGSSALLALILSLSIWQRYFAPIEEPRDLKQILAAWESGQQRRMAHVAQEAVENTSSDAASVIITGSLKGFRSPYVRSDILRVTFDPAWVATLDDRARRDAFVLSLGELLPTEVRTVPEPGALHPAVLLSLLSTISVDGEPEIFKGVSLEGLSKLPPPAGPLFSFLQSQGIPDISHPSVRAAAHLLTGHATVPIVESFMVKPSDSTLSLLQLQLLLPALAKYQSIQEPIFTYLRTLSGEIVEMLEWFDLSQAVEWKNVDRRARLSLVSGVLPETPLSLDQYYDLLSFPGKSARDAARQYLNKNHFSRAHRGMLVILTSPENKLSREQSVLLVSALTLPDEQGFAFFSKWFSNQPDPETVFLLLLSRSKAPRSSPFDIEASRYLINKSWVASVPELDLLAEHPEPIARALSYARLDPKKAEELLILQKRLQAEPNDGLRQQLKMKLGV